MVSSSFYSTHFSSMLRSGTCFTHNAAEIPRLLSPDPGVVKGSRALFSQEDLPRPTHVTSLDIWQLFVVVLLETRGLADASR